MINLHRLFCAAISSAPLWCFPDSVSADALDNWSTNPVGTNVFWLNKVAYGRGGYVAVGWSCSDFGIVLTSEDGWNWTERANGCSPFQSPLGLIGLTHGEGTFVAVGFGSTITVQPTALTGSYDGERAERDRLTVF